MKKNVRASAARIIARLLRSHRPLDQLLREFHQDATEGRDRAFLQELCYGVARWYYRLEPLVDGLLHKALRKRDLEVKAVLLCGVYQIDYLHTPAHAAVSAAVEAVRELGHDWAGPLVNAALRRYLRERAELPEKLLRNPAAIHAHPGWLVKLLEQDWPERWQDILAANNQRPPMHLRINPALVRRDNYLEMLRDNGMEAEPAPWSASGIALRQPQDAFRLPGFLEGLVSVQDFAAQLAAPLLETRAGERVLDACAAPGGKTSHIIENCPGDIEMVAVEKDPARAELLGQTLGRLRLSAAVVCADVTETSWWDGVAFDRILIDAPCSATGVIRRHPDIKLSDRQGQLAGLVETQAKILETVWSLLKHRGKLVYSTCSVLRQENDERIGAFLKQHNDAVNVPIAAPWGMATEHGRQILPGQGDMDGFYYAILEKKAV